MKLRKKDNTKDNTKANTLLRSTLFGSKAPYLQKCVCVWVCVCVCLYNMIIIIIIVMMIMIIIIIMIILMMIIMITATYVHTRTQLPCRLQALVHALMPRQEEFDVACTSDARTLGLNGAIAQVLALSTCSVLRLFYPRCCACSILAVALVASSLLRFLHALCCACCILAVALSTCSRLPMLYPFGCPCCILSDALVVSCWLPLLLHLLHHLRCHSCARAGDRGLARGGNEERSRDERRREQRRREQRWGGTNGHPEKRGRHGEKRKRPNAVLH